MELSEYLIMRGLELNPVTVDAKLDPIMESDALIQEAAELWESKKDLLTMVLQARVNAIGFYILTKAPPQEVLVMRQALVEIGALLDDFGRYHGEYNRRKKPEPTIEVEVEEGKESTL